MMDRARNILLGSAALVGAVGVAAFVLGGLRTTEHCHGIRLAAVLFFCGVLAGHARRRPRMARCAADLGLLLLAAAGVNYLRLALKWHDSGAGEIARWWHIAVMATACLVSTVLLVRAHARPVRRRSPRIRRGLAIAGGALLVGGGIVLDTAPRMPGMVAAAVAEPLHLTEADVDRLGDVLADPARRDRLLRDPRVRETLLRMGVNPDTTDVPSLLRLADRAHAHGALAYDGRPPSEVLSRALGSSAQGTMMIDVPGDAQVKAPIDAPDEPQGDESAADAVPDGPTVVREGVARSVPSTRAPTFTAPEGIGVAARIDPRIGVRIGDRVSGRQLRASAQTTPSNRDRLRRRALALGSYPPPGAGTGVAGPAVTVAPTGETPAPGGSAAPIAPPLDHEIAPPDPIPNPIPIPVPPGADPPDDDAIDALFEMALDVLARPGGDPDTDPEPGASPLSRSTRTAMVILGLVLIGLALARSTRPTPPA